MPCKTCSDRWRIILANQQNNNIMKDDKKVSNDETVVGKVEVPVQGKPNIDKIIKDRRKALLEGKTVNK